MTIRTRFAPSPTGYLHIGGVRTALFNWLLSRQAGGQFILRIDDTDAERNRPEALQPILDGFRWLGIHWDEGPEVGGPHAPYFQSQRGELYRKAALKLLETGHAYPDYMTKEELDADRIKQALKDFSAKNPAAELRRKSRPRRRRSRTANASTSIAASSAMSPPTSTCVCTGRSRPRCASRCPRVARSSSTT